MQVTGNNLQESSQQQIASNMRVRLVKISEQVVGLIADTHLSQADIGADRFLQDSELYYVAHNTNISSRVSICKQGAFRPSKWNQEDLTWLPSLTFYARGHLTHESVAIRKAAEFKSETRPYSILDRAKTRQVDHAKPESGGTNTALTVGYFRDILRSKDGRWAFPCSVAKPAGVAIWVYQICDCSSMFKQQLLFSDSSTSLLHPRAPRIAIMVP